MKAPLENLNRCVAILILGSLGYNDDTIIALLGIHKSTAGIVEKWFRNLPYTEAVLLCTDQRVHDAFIYEISTISKNFMENNKFAIAAQMKADFVLMHYGHLEPGQKVFPPNVQLHRDRLTVAAENIRQNIKAIKQSNVILVGNVIEGSIKTAAGKVEQLIRVDRLDAECLLDHLKATFSRFRDLDDWESLTSRELVVQKVDDSKMKHMKEVSHGLALQGICRICKSWQTPS